MRPPGIMHLLDSKSRRETVGLERGLCSPPRLLRELLEMGLQCSGLCIGLSLSLMLDVSVQGGEYLRDRSGVNALHVDACRREYSAAAINQMVGHGIRVGVAATTQAFCNSTVDVQQAAVEDGLFRSMFGTGGLGFDRGFGPFWPFGAHNLVCQVTDGSKSESMLSTPVPLLPSGLEGTHTCRPYGSINLRHDVVMLLVRGRSWPPLVTCALAQPCGRSRLGHGLLKAKAEQRCKVMWNTGKRRGIQLCNHKVRRDVPACAAVWGLCSSPTAAEGLVTPAYRRSWPF